MQTTFFGRKSMVSFTEAGMMNMRSNTTHAHSNSVWVYQTNPCMSLYINFVGITSLCLFVPWSMRFLTDVSMCAQHPELLKPWPLPGLCGICWYIRRLSYPHGGWAGFSKCHTYHKDPQHLELACESFTMIVCFLTDNSLASLQLRALVVSGMQINRYTSFPPLDAHGIQ